MKDAFLEMLESPKRQSVHHDERDVEDRRDGKRRAYHGPQKARYKNHRRKRLVSARAQCED